MAGSGFEGIEGDLNLSPHRAEWMRGNIGAETSRGLEEDARYFLHQALSTPCLNVLARADGIYLEDLQGRRYMDFHGNSVHQVGSVANTKGRRATRRVSSRRRSPPPNKAAGGGGRSRGRGGRRRVARTLT